MSIVALPNIPPYAVICERDPPSGGKPAIPTKMNSEHVLSWPLSVHRVSEPHERRRFADGPKSDHTAMRVALMLPWSNGHAEGQVNRLKLIECPGDPVNTHCSTLRSATSTSASAPTSKTSRQVCDGRSSDPSAMCVYAISFSGTSRFNRTSRSRFPQTQHPRRLPGDRTRRRPGRWCRCWRWRGQSRHRNIERFGRRRTLDQCDGRAA